MTITVLVEILILITLSGILSASEIGLFSLGRIQLKQIRDQTPTLFRRIRRLIQDPLGLLITILVLNEILNITLGSLITSHFVENAVTPEWLKLLGVSDRYYQGFLGVAITTPLVLLFCELTPKIIASHMNRLVVSAFSSFISVAYTVFTPVHKAIKFFLPTPSAHSETKTTHSLQEDEFLDFIEEQQEQGHVHETELQLIKNVFDLDDVAVETVAIPIRKVRTLPETMTLQDAVKNILGHTEFTRIPIYGKHKEDITGVLHVKDLLQMKLDDDLGKELISTIAKEPLYTSPKTDLETLFRKMRSKKTHVAFLKTGNDRCIAMITMQDILDYLVEEVFEE